MSVWPPHYGIPNVRGDQFRRVTLTDPNRWGLLGKGAILMVTSYPNRTAPVLRGAFILESIAGTPPSPPPPNVPAFKENKDGEEAKTVRQIMEQHRANPSCNACHGVMDPLGFAFENYDTIGAWRSKDKFARTVIDSAGKLVDGTSVNGPADVRKALMKHPDQFVQTMTEKLMTYALGRRLEYYDMPGVRKIVRDAARDNYRFSSIVMGIVKSAPFQMSVKAKEIAAKIIRETAANRIKSAGIKKGSSIMFITKKHLPRRTFLRGVGATMALPLLDAMIPARTALAQTAANPTPHLGFIYFPHGAIMNQWTPATEGSNFELSPILKPLEPFKKHVTVVSGLANRPAVSPAVHAITPGTWLSCVHPRASQDPFGGATVDQIAAEHIGQDTPFPSLEVGDRNARRRRLLRSRFRLQLRRHHLLPHAQHSAAHGERSAQAVPAAVRPGRYARGTQADLQAVFEHSRPGLQGSRRSCSAAWDRRTARWSTIISTPFAKSSGASRRWTRAIFPTSTFPIRPAASRPASSSTST